MGEFLNELDVTEELTEGEAQEYTRHAIVLRNTLRFLRYNGALWGKSTGDPVLVRQSRERKDPMELHAAHLLLSSYGPLIRALPATSLQPERGIDLVRCESLNALDQATRIRVLQRNYAFLISMAPLTRDVKSLSRCVAQQRAVRLLPSSPHCA